MTKSRVAALRVEPSTILESVQRLCSLGGMNQALPAGTTTILKDNISWHFPFPAANTTPWQLEGTILALRAAGLGALSCVQNKTVVTDAFKGEDLNHYLPVLSRYSVPILYNFREGDMKWIVHRPKARMHVLDKIYPEGIRIPDYFFGKNIVHLPTVKCVAGDTELILEDGSLITILNLVQRQMSEGGAIVSDQDDRRVEGRVPLMAMNRDGSIGPHAATWFWKTSRQGRRIVCMRTRTGRTITATADHRIHTPGGWTPIGELSAGSRVALARRVSVGARSQPLPQTFASKPAGRVQARAGRRYSERFIQEAIDAYQDGQTVTAIGASSGVRWQSIQSILLRHGVPLRRNVIPLHVPVVTSPAFWRWVGYVMAEGCVERKTSTKLWWTNTDPVLRRDFVELTRVLFGLHAKEHPSNPGIHIYSRDLGRFLEELGLPVPLNAGNKLVPPLLFQCPEDEIAAFLSGYLDGDGHVSKRQAEVNAVTKSERLSHDLQILFARLGAVAFVRSIDSKAQGWSEARTYYQVSVSGDGVATLASQLNLRKTEKHDRLQARVRRLLSGKRPSNWDVVPFRPDDMRKVRTGLGLTQTAFARPSSIAKVESMNGMLTPRIAREVVSELGAHDRDVRYADEIRTMQSIASGNLAWDEVVEVADVDEDIDLYDVTVPGADSFVGNGLVLHNCHIYTTTTGAMKNAFGGLLHNHRHYTHSWIHRTLVDLLAIQKEIHTGIFAVMDGTTAGNGPGPRTMYPVVKNIMLAGADQVAIDAVAAKMMGFDPMSLEYIRVAHEDGLGVGDPRDIEIVGDDISKESWGFRVGDNGASVVGDLLWFSPLKRFQKLFFRTPLVNVFIFGSEAYHDYYRWPMKDRRVFETWRRDTEWGRLFDRYGAGPIGGGAPGIPAGAGTTG